MKAILVIDKMPKDCASGCPVKCKMRGINHRPSWCPLKPMPNKRPVSYHDDLYGDVEKNYTNIGWNACIEELEK